MRSLHQVRATGAWTQEEKELLYKHATDPNEFFRTIDEIKETGPKTRQEEDQLRMWENRPTEHWHVVQKRGVRRPQITNIEGDSEG